MGSVSSSGGESAAGSIVAEGAREYGSLESGSRNLGICKVGIQITLR